jgi:hypothetical protein
VYPGHRAHLKAGRTTDCDRSCDRVHVAVRHRAPVSLRASDGRLGAIGALGLAFPTAAALLYVAIAMDAGRVADGDEPMNLQPRAAVDRGWHRPYARQSAALVGLSGMSALKNR